MAHTAYAVNTSEALLPLAPFLAVTVHALLPPNVETKILMSKAPAVLPAGTVVENPPESTFNPAGHVAVTVPVVCFSSVSDGPVTY